VRRIQLPGTSLETSVLGFGCAPLMGKVGRRESLALLELAHSLGVSHIDTARSYGYGESESMVGDFIARRRDEVTVTTKFGIAPPRGTRALSLAKSVARRVLARAPRLRTALGRRAGVGGTPGSFTLAEATTSFETSLRELRTDHVDMLLLHEPSIDDLRSGELLGFLQACVDQGKARQFGIASRVPETLEILSESPEYARVIQIPDDVLERSVERMPALRERPRFIHSAIREALPRIRGHLDAEPERQATWSRRLDVDCADPTVLGGLLIGYALQVNPDGVVLFGSQSEDHVRAAVDLTAGAQALSGDQIRRFAELVAGGFGTGKQPALAPD
jgi:aryl-alcohol dehydrogenase-like predicted oxidoreductase